MRALGIVITAVIFLLAGALAGYFFRDDISRYLPGSFRTPEMAGMAKSGSDAAAENEATRDKPAGERRILFYRNPMSPSITSPVPAKDSMGMDYVPVYADSGGASNEPAGTVTINPVVEQNIGVRTGRAEQRLMSREVRTYGQVRYDEKRIYSVHPRFRGWLERVYVQRNGDLVRQGQLLAAIYSPELLSTQQEYLIALQGMRAAGDAAEELPGLRSNAEALVNSARRRLELFGVSDADIRRLEKSAQARTSLEIRSPYAGTVIKVNAFDGLAVSPATELYRIADLSSVWIVADVYEPDFPWVEQGDRIDVTSAAVPGEIFKGTVEFVYPYEREGRRTVQVRMVAMNRRQLLKPGMFVNAVIHASQIRTRAVPSEAVLRTGTRDLVFVQRAPGKFEPRDVVTGVETDGYTQIKKGIDAGEEVVLSGQFLIDSESKLREATLKMISGSKGKQAMKDMPGMSDMKTGASGSDKGSMEESGHEAAQGKADGKESETMPQTGSAMQDMAPGNDAEKTPGVKMKNMSGPGAGK